MASHNLLPCLVTAIAITLISQAFASDNMYPFTCSYAFSSCNALLYHINKGGLSQDQIAAYYNVSVDLISPIDRGNGQDYLVLVFASCNSLNGTTAYFYDAPYTVRQNDTFASVSEKIYSGQAWSVGGEEGLFVPGNVVSMHLLAGCVDNESPIVTTYTVQENDTITDIANRLFSSASGIQSMNSMLITDPNFLIEGWVLFVPTQLSAPPAPSIAPSVNN